MIQLYPDYLLEGNLVPGSFGSQIDDICQTIHDSTKGFGTDEKYVDIEDAAGPVQSLGGGLIAWLTQCAFLCLATPPTGLS
jgi:hypothetical protein